MKIEGTKIIMKRKDFVKCYLQLRPIIKEYFEGNITLWDFFDRLKPIYDIWFS